MPTGSKNGNWRGGREKYCVKCGEPRNKGSRALCKKCYKPATFLGRKHTPETREKMKASAKLRDRSTYLGPTPNPERSRMVQRRYWSRLNKIEKMERLKTFIIAGQKFNKKSSKTKQEVKIAEILDRLNLKYEWNFYLNGLVVDFLIGKTVVECFGDYWHCNPGKYTSDFYNKSLHMTAEEKWEKDSARIKKLESLGYKVNVLWESDIISGGVDETLLKELVL